MVYRSTKVFRSIFRKLPQWRRFAMATTPTADVVKVSRTMYVGNQQGTTNVPDVSVAVVTKRNLHLMYP